MKHLQYDIFLKAAPERVWNCLWDVEKYKIWTRPFCEGSYYEAKSLREGELIYFYTPEGQGMVCVIEKSIENQRMDIRHLGDVQKLKGKDLQDQIKSGKGAMETYNLEAVEGGTRLKVEVDAPEEYYDFMDKAFRESLQILKEMTEKK